MECFADERHDGDGDGKLDGDEAERDSAQAQDVAEEVAGAEEHDSGLEPEVVSGDAGTEDLGDAHGVGDDQAEDDRPEDVLDVREREVMGLAVVAQESLADLARIADGEQEEDAGQDPPDPGTDAQGTYGNDDGFAHGVLTRERAATVAPSRALRRRERRSPPTSRSGFVSIATTSSSSREKSEMAHHRRPRARARNARRGTGRCGLQLKGR